MIRILKFVLENKACQSLEIPQIWKPMKVEFQPKENRICLWVMADERSSLVGVSIWMKATGESLTTQFARNYKHIGTAQFPGDLVWHFFVEKEKLGWEF